MVIPVKNVLQNLQQSFRNSIGPSEKTVDKYIRAALWGDIDTVKDFVSKYPKHIDKVDDRGFTALYQASASDDKNYLKIMDFLLENGANKSVTCLGNTLFHNAIGRSTSRAMWPALDLENIALLIKHNVPLIDTQEKVYGLEPLAYAKKFSALHGGRFEEALGIIKDYARKTGYKEYKAQPITHKRHG